MTGGFGDDPVRITRSTRPMRPIRSNSNVWTGRVAITLPSSRLPIRPQSRPTASGATARSRRAPLSTRSMSHRSLPSCCCSARSSFAILTPSSSAGNIACSSRWTSSRSPMPGSASPPSRCASRRWRRTMKGLVYHCGRFLRRLLHCDPLSEAGERRLCPELGPPREASTRRSFSSRRPHCCRAVSKLGRAVRRPELGRGASLDLQRWQLLCFGRDSHITGGSGELAAYLPEHSSPDSSNTLSVDLTESRGQLGWFPLPMPPIWVPLLRRGRTSRL